MNPLRGVIIEGKYFDYNSDSFRVTAEFRNSFSDAETNRQFTTQGLNFNDYSLSLVLGNETVIPSTLGATRYFEQGVTKLAFLENLFNATGSSLPITFVDPSGSTRLVVPIGAMDITEYNSSLPAAQGMEWIVNISLADTTSNVSEEVGTSANYIFQDGNNYVFQDGNNYIFN